MKIIYFKKFVTIKLRLRLGVKKSKYLEELQSFSQKHSLNFKCECFFCFKEKLYNNNDKRYTLRNIDIQLIFYKMEVITKKRFAVLLMILLIFSLSIFYYNKSKSDERFYFEYEYDETMNFQFKMPLEKSTKTYK